jgi:D-methionine transport system substrate-binding protein
MKKLNIAFASIALLSGLTLTGCSQDNSKVIKVAASETPHAKVLNECVADILKEKGYTLKVRVLDWTQQNSAVASKDYDANYFQHIPYLNTFEGTGEQELVASVKVHYEPLSIYRGKSNASLSEGKTFAICNDTSNAIRAFQLLKAKGVLDTIPVSEDGQELTFSSISTEWTSENGISVKLIQENLLTSSLGDYDFVLLPANTAYTGNVSGDKLVAKEDDPEQVSSKANVLAVRKYDYLNNETYKAKIDVLSDALLSSEVSSYFATTFLNAMTCDASTQIDLRNQIA